MTVDQVFFGLLGFGVVGGTVFLLWVSMFVETIIEANKPKDWEPPSALETRIKKVIEDTIAQQISGDGQGGVVTVPGPSIPSGDVQELKEMIMALSASVQKLVDQVAASVSYEASQKAAMQELVNQSKNLTDQVAALTAAGTGMSADDAAAVAKAAQDLHDSASALQEAVPASVAPDPAAPAVDIPVATPGA